MIGSCGLQENFMSSHWRSQIVVFQIMMIIVGLLNPIYELSAEEEAQVKEAFSFLKNGVTAHRGNSGEYPENTMAAFQSGIELGPDWIELDLFRTKDG